MASQPEAILIAGANGAGKTTFARQVLRVQFPGATFLNADEIQREQSAFAHPVAAGRELVRRLDELANQRMTFAVETTLASRNYVGKLQAWADVGYRTTLHFIELPSADYAVRRVAGRVAAGGHAVAEADIRRRFDRGLRLFLTVYKPMVIGGIIGSATTEDCDLPTPDQTDLRASELEILLEAARRANWDALHGPRHLRSGRFRPEVEAGVDEAAQPPAAAGRPRDDNSGKQDPARAPRPS
ncbi:MAG: zeta toxin family protein [Planctomycetota bacterium]